MTPKKIAQFAIGPAGGAIFSVLTLPIITWYFSQGDVGRLMMLQMAVSFTALVFTFGLDRSYVREFHNTSDKASLLKNTLFPPLTILIGISILLLIIAPTYISEMLFGERDSTLSVFVTATVISALLTRFFSLTLRMNERGIAFSLSQLLPKCILLLVVLYYIASGTSKNLTALILAQTIAYLSVCVIFSWNTRKEWLSSLRSRMDPSQFRSLLKFGFPLVFGGLAYWGLTASDKIFLRAFSDYEELGLYSVAVRFAAAATILQSVFSTVWIPTVYKWEKEGKNFQNIDLVMRYVLLCVIVIFCFAGLFSWILNFIIPNQYTQVQFLVIACLSYPLLYTLSETTVVGINISRNTSFAMLASVLALAINLLGNWLLIPKYGASGAAISSSIAFFAFFIFRTEFSSYLWRKIPKKSIYIYTFILTSGAILTNAPTVNTQLISTFFWAFVFSSTFIIFKKEYAQTFGFLLKRVERLTHSKKRFTQ